MYKVLYPLEFEMTAEQTRSYSRISFGGAALSGEGGGYGFGEMSEVEAEAILKAALDFGIDVFDSAPIYGFGLSEERMGRYLPKDKMIITKGGVDWHSTKRVNMTNDPKVIERMFFASMKRLKRDFIDVYMIHWPDAKVDIRRPMEILANLQSKGYVNKLGLCNTNLNDLALSEEIAKIEVIQSELNLFNTKPFDDLGDKWKEKFSMSWGTLDKGILSGRVKEGRKYDAADARSWAPWWNKKEVSKKVQRVEVLKSILEDYRISLVNFCFQFNLHYYGIDSALIGFKKIEDIVQVTSNLQQNMTNEIIKEIFERWHKTE